MQKTPGKPAPSQKTPVGPMQKPPASRHRRKKTPWDCCKKPSPGSTVAKNPLNQPTVAKNPYYRRQKPQPRSGWVVECGPRFDIGEMCL